MACWFRSAFTEGTEASVGCLWNSNVLIGANGAILNHHRKLMPTFYEKLVWASGDGRGLRVVETEIGRLGMLICGENTNPLARYALMAQGEQVHMSSYPPVWPTRPVTEKGGYDLRRAIEIRAGAHAFEAKVFNIVASGAIDLSMRDVLARASTSRRWRRSRRSPRAGLDGARSDRSHHQRRTVETTKVSSMPRSTSRAASNPSSSMTSSATTTALTFST